VNLSDNLSLDAHKGWNRRLRAGPEPISSRASLPAQCRPWFNAWSQLSSALSECRPLLATGNPALSSLLSPSPPSDQSRSPALMVLEMATVPS